MRVSKSSGNWRASAAGHLQAAINHLLSSVCIYAQARIAFLAAYVRTTDGWHEELLVVGVELDFQEVLQALHFAQDTVTLMTGIFPTKYMVGAALVIPTKLRQQAVFCFVVPALYGAFSGVFMARAARLWTLAIRTGTMTVGTSAA
jgi:hypothetical protein